MNFVKGVFRFLWHLVDGVRALLARDPVHDFRSAGGRNVGGNAPVRGLDPRHLHRLEPEVVGHG